MGFRQETIGGRVWPSIQTTGNFPILPRAEQIWKPALKRLRRLGAVGFCAKKEEKRKTTESHVRLTRLEEFAHGNRRTLILNRDFLAVLARHAAISCRVKYAANEVAVRSVNQPRCRSS
jgi:hypothetical protein